MDIAAFMDNLATPAQRKPWTSRSFRKPLLCLRFFHVHSTTTRGCFDGLRHDSGDPVWWGEKALAAYAQLRIDAHTKRLVFSDSLTLPKALELYRHFADRTQLGFGIGTHVSNDMGLKTLHIVMKLTRANGQPVAKLSDSPGKTLCEDETFLAYLRQVFKVPALPQTPTPPP
jgi:nicotinic acid phosphoribosyltransferase